MPLSLASAEDQVRDYTRHTNDLTRLPQAKAWRFLNTRYRYLRTWLQDAAPSLYLQTSDPLTLADGDVIDLGAVNAYFERLYRVDRQDPNGHYREVEMAGKADPNVHVTGRITYREEGQYLLFGPDTFTAGIYRVLYHRTPVDLASGSELFVLPQILELPLILLTCVDVTLSDSDDPKDFSKQALALLEGDNQLPGARKELSRRDGVHQRREGLQRKMGRW